MIESILQKLRKRDMVPLSTRLLIAGVASLVVMAVTVVVLVVVLVRSSDDTSFWKEFNKALEEESNEDGAGDSSGVSAKGDDRADEGGFDWMLTAETFMSLRDGAKAGSFRDRQEFIRRYAGRRVTFVLQVSDMIVDQDDGSINGFQMAFPGLFRSISVWDQGATEKAKSLLVAIRPGDVVRVTGTLKDVLAFPSIKKVTTIDRID